MDKLRALDTVTYNDNGKTRTAEVLFVYETMAVIKPFGNNAKGVPIGISLVPFRCLTKVAS